MAPSVARSILDGAVVCMVGDWDEDWGLDAGGSLTWEGEGNCLLGRGGEDWR